MRGARRRRDEGRLRPRRLDLSWLDLPSAHQDATRARLLRGEARVRAGAEPDALQVSELLDTLPPGAIAVPTGGLTDLALDATHLFVAGHQGLYRIPRGGGEPQVLFARTTREIALVEGGVVFATDDGVLRVDRGGSDAARLAGMRGIRAFAVDDRTLYVHRSEEATIVAVPLGGGPELVVASTQKVASLAVDATHVLWTDYFAQSVRRAPKGGGPVSDVATLYNPREIVATPDRVIWSSWLEGSGAVWAMPAGGRPTRLAEAQSIVEALSAGGDAIAWSIATPKGRALRVLRGEKLHAVHEVGERGTRVIATATDGEEVFVATRCLGTEMIFRIALPPE